jgi:hypothetical protein
LVFRILAAKVLIFSDSLKIFGEKEGEGVQYSSKNQQKENLGEGRK